MEAFDVIEVDVKPKSNYIPPEEGMHRAALVDVIDLGMQPNRFNPEKANHVIKFVYELETIRPGTTYHYTLSERFNLSFHEKATLAKRLKGWKVDIPTEGRFSFSTLKNRPAVILVEHNVGGDGKTYANVGKVMQDKSDTPYVPSGDYKRRDRSGATEDDEVPF